MKKKPINLLVWLLVIIMLVLPCAAFADDSVDPVPPYLAEHDYRIWGSGEYLSPEVPPETLPDGTLLVPLRAVLDAAGVSVLYDAASHSAVAKTAAGETVSLNLKTGGVAGHGTYAFALHRDRALVSLGFFDLLGLSVTQDEYTKTAVVSGRQATYGDVIPYDLGSSELSEYEFVLDDEGTYVEDFDKPVTIPHTMTGVMAVPDKKNCPVAVFVHGCHSIKTPDETRYDLGFSYLMKELATQGYAVFSLNMNMEFSTGENWELVQSERAEQIIGSHLTRMIQANAGTDTGFPLSLKGRLDTQNITLIGHSRNAYGIFGMTETVAAAGGRVNGLFSVAPALALYVESLPDVPTAIVIPARDGDVTDLWGQWVYDRIAGVPDRKSDAYLAYIYNANHDSFNEALLYADDRYTAEGVPNPPPLIPQALQRDMYQSFLLDFMKAVNGNSSLNSLPHSLSGDFYGQKALTSFFGGTRQTLFSAGKPSGGTISAVNAEIQEVTGSVLSNHTAGAMRFPGMPMGMPLCQIAWQTSGAKAVLALAASADATPYTALALDLAQDSSSEKNGGKDQSMTVLLTDTSGKTAQIVLPEGTAALSHQTGTVAETISPFDGSVVKKYTEYTPLSSMVLPLKDFKGVDLNALKSVTLQFERGSGCIVVRSVTLVK